MLAEAWEGEKAGGDVDPFDFWWRNAFLLIPELTIIRCIDALHVDT